MPGTPGAYAGSSAARQRSREQQAVLNRLRQGGSITGAQPANPFIAGIQNLFGGAGAGTIPPLSAAALRGQPVLMNRGGWDSRVAGSGPINVGGQTWYPAQSGTNNLVYKLAPGKVGGQYGSIFVKNQLADIQAPTPTVPGPASPAAERAYRQEVSSIAQQAAQNPELQRYEKESAAAAASKDQGRMDAMRDLGMQIWAQKYGKPGDLASRVKPGQSGYDVIQRTLGAGQMGSPMNFGFDASSPLATTPPVAAPSYAGVTPASLPGATPLPSNAFSGMVTTPYDRFNAGQTLTSAPLGMPGAQIPGTYEGATGVQGMGASLGATPSMFNPSDEKAKALLEAFKNKQFGVQK